jgi:hypothetical protein
MFQLSGDPLLVDKVFDVVGLYLNPPKGAVVLFAAFSTADGTGISSLHRRHRVWIAPPTTADVGLLRSAD